VISPEEMQARVSEVSISKSPKYQKIADCFDSLGVATQPTGSQYMMYTKKNGALYGDSLSNIRQKYFGSSISEALQDFFWIDILNPSSTDFINLRETFGVHQLTIEDIQANNSRQKFDDFKKYYFVVLKVIDDRDYHNIQKIQVSVIVFPTFMLSLQFSTNKPHVPAAITRLELQESINSGKCF
jgi:Mg2+ and Co2+ transporter CorA